MLRTLFILGILGSGVALSLRSRYAALLLYLWWALFRPQDWVWIDISSLRVSLLLGMLLLVPAIVTGLLPNVTNPLSIGMVLFLASTIATQAVAVRPDFGWQWVDFLFRLFVTSMMIVTLARDDRRLAGVLAVVSISLGFHAAKAGLAFVVGGGMRFADGLAGAFVDNNGYALGTVMIMPLLLATAQNAGLLMSGPLLPWVRRGLYAAVPLCGFAVIGTYSRGGFLSLSAATLVFVLLQRRRSAALAGLAATLSVVLLVVPIPQSYLDRLQTIQTYKEVEEESALSRPHFWQVGLRMVDANPLGVGVKQYELAYDKYDFSYGRFGHHRAVHSSHIQVLAELGYPGALVWLGLFGYATFACLRVRVRSARPGLSPERSRFLRTAADGLLVSMTGFVVGGSFLSLALNDVTWLIFGMVGALDRISAPDADLTSPLPMPIVAGPAPVAFRVVDSFASPQGTRS